MVPTADAEMMRAAAAATGTAPCDPPVPALAFGTTPDAEVSKQLLLMYTADQSARASANVDWAVVEPADRQRRVDAAALIAQGKIVTPLDAYYAAMIFQHGNCGAHYQLASALAEHAAADGSPQAKWLYAAALDRFLQSQGKLQRFGTQYFRFRDRWELYPIDPATTDEERARYGVEPLARILARVDELNRRQPQ